MIRGKYRRERLALLYSLCFIGAMVCSMMCLGIYSGLTTTNVDTTTDGEDQDTHPIIPHPLSSGDGSSYYKEVPLTIDDSQFSTNNDYDGWTPEQGDGILDVASGRVVFEVDQAITTYNNYPRIVISLPQFWEGEIEISWGYLAGTEAGEQLELRYMSSDGSDWSSATLLHATSSASYDTDTFLLNHTIGTTNANFKLAIVFVASRRTSFPSDTDIDYAYVTYATIRTQEFCIWESSGDQIPQQNTQTMQVYIYSSTGTISNVRIQYKLNSNDFSSGTTTEFCGTSGGNYTYTFSASIYDYNDDIYYRIIYNNGAERPSKTTNFDYFDAYDNTNPSLTYLSINDTSPMYYEDIAVNFRASEITQDSLISSIYLYAKNGSAATTSDYRISSNMTGFPYQNQDFKFVMKHFILTARQVMYVLVRVTDGAGRYTDYTNSFIVGDNVAPRYSFVSINDSTVEYWEDVKVTYNVVEPSDASGFATSGSQLRLGYKFTSIPIDFDDYVDLIAPSNTISQNGGNIEFIIPDSILDYGDTLYYWILLVDIAFNVNGSDYQNYRNFVVRDLVGPVAVSQVSNTQDANYYANKTLTFQITEPNDASGVNTSSLRVWFKVGNSNLNTGAIQINYTSISPANYYNFIVDNNTFTLGNTVYFKVNGTDYYGNTFTTIVEHFYVSDLEAPTISFVSAGSNNDTAEYTRATTMVYDSDDVAGGFGFETIVMFVKNGSAASYYGSGCIRINYDSFDGTEYTFIIPSILHSARQNLYWIVRANDTLGNYRELSGNFQVDDLVQPFIQFSSITPSISTIDYNEDVTVWWYIHEPIAGAGFSTSGLNLAVYYFVGSITLTPSHWQDGTKVTCTGSLSTNGGTFSTVIPESAFKYGDVVYFWGWVQDQASPSNNGNNTFINRKQFTVIDTISPSLFIQSSSLTNASYDDPKIITYNAIEPTDASGLYSATVFWRRNNDQVTEFINDGSQANATILPHSGSGLTLTISYAVLHAVGAKYGDTIYFIVVVVDKALYKSTSGVNSFKIGDDVLPTLIQHPDNTDNIIKTNGKTFSAQVWDPDYDYSSGVSSIHIFYLLNDESVSTSHYTAVIAPQESIVKVGGTYSFKILGALSSTWADDTVVYYIIRVIDINGNINISTVQSFIARKMVTVTYLLPSTNRDYYNTPYINLSLTVDIPCDLWYQIDNEPESSPIYGLILTAYFNFATEGAHNITAFYFSSKYNRTFNFITDFTPPAAVGEVRIEMSGSSVRLSWAPATDAVSYTILRSKSEQGPYIQIGSTPARTFSDYATDFGTTYYYKVVAVDRANNQTQPVAAISINVPVPIWIWIALLGVVGAAALVFIKVRASAKSKAAIRDLGTLSEEEKQRFTVSDEEIAAKQKKTIETEKIADETQWKKIDWKAQTTAPKGKYDLYVDESEKLFWKHNIEVLVEEGVKYELAGKFGLALKAYQIALRAAENDIYGDKEILAYLKDKLVSIYSNPLIQ